MATSISELRQPSHQTHTKRTEFDQLLQRPAFSAEAWHAMSERDNQLIADSILHGYLGQEYIYAFKISGKSVEGISVIGARELAAQYGGIQSKLLSSADKTGSLIITKSYGDKLSVDTQIVPQIEDDDDWYEVVLEIKDVKTGNAINIRKKEYKTGRTTKGDLYTKEHYDTIAESKAYRNGVLSIIPQSTITKFKEKCKTIGRVSDEFTNEQMAEHLLGWCAKNKIGIDRRKMQALTHAELRGLGATTRESINAFKEAALALDILKAPLAQVPTSPAASPSTASIASPRSGSKVPPEHQDAWITVMDAYDEGGIEGAQAAFDKLNATQKKALAPAFKTL